MDLCAGGEEGEVTAGLEDEGEREVVGSVRGAEHGGEEVEGVAGKAGIDASANEDVIQKSGLVGNFDKQLACVGELAGKGVHGGESGEEKGVAEEKAG